jgi:hypothetical protein
MFIWARNLGRRISSGVRRARVGIGAGGIAAVGVGAFMIAAGGPAGVVIVGAALLVGGILVATGMLHIGDGRQAPRQANVPLVTPPTAGLPDFSDPSDTSVVDVAVRAGRRVNRRRTRVPVAAAVVPTPTPAPGGPDQNPPAPLPGLSIPQKRMIKKIALEELRGITQAQLHGIAQHVQRGLAENQTNLQGIQDIAAEYVDEFPRADLTGQQALNNFVGQPYGTPDARLQTRAQFIGALNNRVQRAEANLMFSLFDRAAQVVLGGAAAINPAIDNAFAAQHRQGEAVLEVMADMAPFDEDDLTYRAAEDGLFAQGVVLDDGDVDTAIGERPDNNNQTAVLG